MSQWKKEQARLKEILGEDRINNMRRYLNEKKYLDFPGEISMKTPDGQTVVTNAAESKEFAETQIGLVDAQNEIDFLLAMERMGRWLNLFN